MSVAIGAQIETIKESGHDREGIQLQHVCNR